LQRLALLRIFVIKHAALLAIKSEFDKAAR